MSPACEQEPQLDGPAAKHSGRFPRQCLKSNRSLHKVAVSVQTSKQYFQISLTEPDCVFSEIRGQHGHIGFVPFSLASKGYLMVLVVLPNWRLLSMLYTD